MIVLLLFATLINSLIVEAIVFEESYEYDTLEQLEELNATEHKKLVMHHCSNLEEYMEYHRIEDIVSTLNTLFDLHYPKIMPPRYHRRNDYRNDLQERFDKIFQECGLVIEFKTAVTNINGHQREPAGTIEIRTLNKKNANLVIKHLFRRSACTALRHLLQCLEASDFSQLYPNETVIAFAFETQVKFCRIIQEWVGLLVQDGRIIEEQHAAKCLSPRTFGDLKYKGRSFFDYFTD